VPTAANLRVKRQNPFASSQDRNPFQLASEVKLVPVPDAPETHEKRVPRRNYLSAGPGGGIDLEGLFAGAGRGRKGMVPHETARQPEEPMDEPATVETPPPRYGYR
jgi:hypothetical protein